MHIIPVWSAFLSIIKLENHVPVCDAMQLSSSGSRNCEESLPGTSGRELALRESTYPGQPDITVALIDVQSWRRVWKESLQNLDDWRWNINTETNINYYFLSSHTQAEAGYGEELRIPLLQWLFLLDGCYVKMYCFPLCTAFVLSSV